jgi:hypothetical protein
LQVLRKVGNQIARCHNQKDKRTAIPILIYRFNYPHCNLFSETFVFKHSPFSDVTLCSTLQFNDVSALAAYVIPVTLLSLLCDPQDGESTFIRIFGQLLVDYMTSHHIIIATAVITSNPTIIYSLLSETETSSPQHTEPITAMQTQSCLWA